MPREPMQLCEGCSARPPVGKSKMCTTCAGWKSEVDDLAAVNAHHVDERDAALRKLSYLRRYLEAFDGGNVLSSTVLSILDRNDL